MKFGIISILSAQVHLNNSKLIGRCFTPQKDNDPKHFQCKNWEILDWLCNSAEFLNVLNYQVIPSIDLFFADGSGIFQDDNAKIDQALVVKEWRIRTHECQGARGVIFTCDFTPLKVFGM